MSTYTIPNVITRTPQGERVMDVYSRLLDDRILYLGTELDDGVANALIAQILHLDSDNPDAPIEIYINSPGASVTATFASTTPCSTVTHRSPPPVWDKHSRRRRCCSPPGHRAGAQCFRTRAFCSISPPAKGVERFPT